MIILLASAFIINIFVCEECNEMARCRSEGEWVSRNSGPFPFCPLREIIRSGHTQGEWVFVIGRGFESWIIYWTRHIFDSLIQQDGDGSFSNLHLLSAGVSRLTTSRRFTLNLLNLISAQESSFCQSGGDEMSATSSGILYIWFDGVPHQMSCYIIIITKTSFEPSSQSPV